MNIINAIYNLVHHTQLDLLETYKNKNRANSTGDALEEYVKDLFSNAFGLTEVDRMERWDDVFSYLGNSNNPPDIILKDGDAIEVKKIESLSDIALNSSHPKHTLKKSSALISNACRQCEDWEEKDIIYVIGLVKNKRLHTLFMVYGLDYCASEECYIRIKEKIKDVVENIDGIHFSESKEIGHVNKVDPLGITYLRIRSMWGIENPAKVFRYIYDIDKQKQFNFMALINQDKWSKFDNLDLILHIQKEGFTITDVRIKNPDNPAQLRDAKLIKYEI